MRYNTKNKIETNFKVEEQKNNTIYNLEKNTNNVNEKNPKLLRIFNNKWISGILIGVVIGLILYYVFGIGKTNEKTINQNHSGSGNNIAGNQIKNVIIGEDLNLENFEQFTTDLKTEIQSNSELLKYFNDKKDPEGQKQYLPLYKNQLKTQTRDSL